MYSLKNNGDNIAQEFAGLMGSAAVAAPAPPTEVVKTASLGEEPQTADVNMSLDSELEDMILEGNEADNDYASDLIDDDIADMDSYAGFNPVLTAKTKFIVTGLRKISADLKTKGEAFASDVVEATARSIIGDFKKEASKSNEVADTLSKIAKELSESGDQFAADMVLATLNKIS